MSSFLTSNRAARRFFVGGFSFLLSVALCVGCKRDDASNADADPNAKTTDDANVAAEFPQFSIEVRNLSAEKLAELGAKNELPTEFIFPNAYYAQIMRPDRLNDLPAGADALQYFENSTLQFPPNFGLLAKADLVVSSKTFSLETLKNAKTDEILQENFPAPAEAVYLRSVEPLDQKAILDAIFNVGGRNDQVKTQTFGGQEVQTFESSFGIPLDQTGQNFGKIDRALAGVCFPTPNALLLLSGSPSSFESFFNGKPGDERGIVAQQAGRVALDALDVAFLYDYDAEVATTQLVPLPFPTTTQELVAAIQKHVLSFRFVANASQADGDLLTLTVDAKTEEGANELKKTIGGALMQVVDNVGSLVEQAEAQGDAPVAAAERLDELKKLIALLKTAALNVDGTKVVGTLKNAPEALDFVGGVFKNMNEFNARVEQDSKYALVDQAVFQLGRAFQAYLGKNQKFPAPIRAADGAPLLSWRVALLPSFGDEGQKLFDQFKLDEPWNGENNVKLLEKIPAFYASPIDSKLGVKTPFLVVNSPNSPFGRAPEGLKIQDSANPSRTLSVVCADSKNAVEWTRPEEFAFDPENPTDAFGPVLCGVTLMGEIVRFAIDDSPETARQIANLIFGEAEAQPAPEVESSAQAPETEAQPAPEVESSAQAPEAEAQPAPEVESSAQPQENEAQPAK